MVDSMMHILSTLSSCSLKAISKVSTSKPNMVIKTIVLGFLSNSPLSPVCLSWSHEEGGGSVSGGKQVVDGGTCGDRAARWDSDMIGSDVMGRSSFSGGGVCEGSTGSTG